MNDPVLQFMCPADVIVPFVEMLPVDPDTHIFSTQVLPNSDPIDNPF